MDRPPRRCSGLTLPVDIPPSRASRQTHNGERSSFDDDSSPKSHSPTRHISTQTPTEHFSFTFDLTSSVTASSYDDDDSVNPNPRSDTRKRPILYGKHSFREVREMRWIPRWLRRSDSDSAPMEMERGMQRAVSISLSPEDAKAVGKQLRIISDDFEVCRGRSQLQITNL